MQPQPRTFLALGTLLVLATVLGCSDVERRRLDTIQNLTLTSQEMEDFVRAQLQKADTSSLQKPVLLVARHYFKPDVAQPVTENLREFEIIVMWTEAWPTIDEVKLVSPSTGSEVYVAMTQAQIKENLVEAEQGVLYAQSFRVNADSKVGQKLICMIRDGTVHAILIRRKSEESFPVILTAEGESCERGFLEGRGPK